LANVTKFTPNKPFIGSAIINGKERTVVSFELENDSTAISEYDSMHHIHILDRSGSMTNHIDELMENVKKTLRIIDPNDYITIIWFSGVGQYRSVVKCSKNDPETLDKILDSLKSTVGCTCFSDPINELRAIIEETYPICNAYNVTIFTDGEPVTPWSTAKEYEKIFEGLDAIKDKIIAFNTIGYGGYYNRDLLLKMSNTTEYGIMTHASEVSNYEKIFSHNRESIISMVGKRVKIIADNCDIITESSINAKLFRDKATIRLTKTRNVVDIIFDSKVDRVSYIIDRGGGDGEAYSIAVPKTPRTPMSKLDDIMYHYAYTLFYNNRKSDAADVLNFIGNKVILDQMMNSYSLEEVGNFINTFRNYMTNPESRPRSKIKRNSYIPDDKAICVIDILRALVNVEATYVPVKNYNRISKEVKDTSSLFKRSSDEPCKMTNLVFNSSRLNLSIQFIAKGTVNLDPFSASAVGLPEVIDAKVFRNHAIIKDGVLNIKTLTVILPDDVIKLLEEGGDTTEPEYIVLKELKKYQTKSNKSMFKIPLNKYPLINQSYANMTLKEFYATEYACLQNEAANKVYNYFIKNSESLEGATDSKYSYDQLLVLKDHGLNASLTYSAVSPQIQEAKDYYIAREFRTYFKGFSALPSINSVIQKINSSKKLTPSESLIHHYYTRSKDLSIEDLKNMRTCTKKLLIDRRIKLSAAKLAMTLTGKWFSELTPKESGEYEYTDNYGTLVIKLNRVVVAV
jgi:hypothetical protein